MPPPTTRSRSIYGFDPSSAPGCILWLDAADPTTLFSDSAGTTLASVSGTVGYWRDKSPCLNNYIQTTSADRPTYSSASNISFGATTATNAVLSNANSNVAGGWDIFVVGRPLGSSGNSWRTLLRGLATDHPIIVNSGGTQLGYYNNGTGAFYQFGSLTLDGAATALLYVSISASRSYSAALNGTLTTSAASTAGTADTNMFYWLGNSSGRQQAWGTLNEMIIMSNTTTAYRQQVEGYLAWKWGLQANLPTGHPFKVSPTASRIFTPNDLDQCVLWLDAADATTMTYSSGSNISSWRDKSSSQTSATTTVAGSYTCTYSSASNSVVFYNGTTTGFTAGNYAYMTVQSNIQTTADYTVVAVVLASNVTTYTNGNIYQNWRNANAPNVTESRAPGFWVGGVADFGTTGYRSGILSPNAATTVRPSNPSILMVRSSAAAFEYFFNGILISRDTTAITRYSTDAGQLPQIGGSWNTTTGTSADGRWFSGQIYELIVYNQALSEADRRRIEGYFIQKWNPFATSSYTFRNYINGYYPSVTTSLQPNDASISGNLQVWCDATSYSTNGQALTSWINKSSSGVVLTCAGNPTVYTNQLKGQPIVRFATGSQWYNSSLAYTNYTIFFVGRQTGVTNRRVLQAYTGNQLYGYWAGYKRVIYLEADPVILNSGFLSDTSWDIMAVYKRNTGQDFTMFWNGVVMTGFQTSTATNMNGITINGGAFSAESSTCEVAEIIIYNSVLSMTQMRQIQIYLAQKWGLALSPGNLLAYSPTSSPIISPLQISPSGVLLWLDATDPAGNRTQPANGSTFTSWVDKSGNGRNLGVGSGTTTWNTSSVRLSSSYMFVTSAVDLTNASLFIVVASPTATNNQTVFIGRPNISFDYNSLDGFGFYVDNNNGTRVFGTTTAGQFTQFANTGLVATFMTSATFTSAGSISSWRNGGTLATATTSARTTTAQGFGLGASWNGTAYNNIVATSYIFEVVVFNTALSTFQRQQMEGYLAWKWGIQNSLPTTHPYYKNRP
jgi:hypothetical protein